MTVKPLPSQEELKRALDYDPETGVFTWRHRPEMGLRWNTRYAGKRAGSWQQSAHPCWVINLKKGDKKVYYTAHRLAWVYVHGHLSETDIIDHANCDRDDNRICNLRLATPEGNSANRRRLRNNTSGFKGVNYHVRSRKWVARVGIGGSQRRHLGMFDSAEEAYAVWVEATKAQYGEFARLA
jgi:hypothetical protein